MKFPGWDHGVLLTWLLAANMSVAGAAVPSPVPKPLQTQSEEDMDERERLPRAKPSEANRTTEESADATLPRAECTVSDAVIERTEPFSGALKMSDLDDDACGIASPVRLVSVGTTRSEVHFPENVLVSCEFAQVVTDWLLQDVVPAARDRLDRALTGVGSGPGYQCRRRNNLADGKLSEHATGNAIDISHLTLEGGLTVSVEEDWSAETAEGAFLREIHAAACKRFTTVLGPDADPNHKSHFHLDTGCHGRDCTYLICQ